MTPQIICFCLLVMGVSEMVPSMAASPAVDTGWQLGKVYEYEVQGSVYATLPQLGDQATGVEVRARLLLQRSPSQPAAHAHTGRRELVAWVESARVAERQRVTRPEGSAPPPDNRLRFRPLPLQPGAWTLRLTEHGVGSLLVNESWIPSEVNFIKALASRLVLNTGGTKTDDERPDVEFTVMEESVTGRCSTEYAVAPLDDVGAPAPGPARAARASRPRRLLRVSKARDYERCERLPGFRRPSALASAPASLSTEEVIIRGSLSEYIIYSSTITDKIVMEQSSLGQPQGLIESHLSIKLVRLKESHKPAASLGPLRHVDLVYHEEDPFLPENYHIHKRESTGTPDHEDNTTPEDINDDIHHVHKKGRALVEPEDTDTLQRKQKAGNGGNNTEIRNTTSKFHPLFNSSHQTGPVIFPLVHSLQLIDQLSQNNSSPFAFSLELPPNIPVRPFFRGNSTTKLSDSEKKAFARRLIQNISSTLQDPNQMPKLHTLSSFSILVELLRTLSYNQLKDLSKHFEAARTSEEAVSGEDEFKWCAWRDAVGAAGSGPALLLLAAWAAPGGLLAPWEAATLLSALPSAALRPDRAYAHRLFELVLAWERAAEGGAVHRAATQALAELLPAARRSATTSASLRAAGATARVHGTAASYLLGVFVPHLQRQLRQAADRQDAAALQLYVRALGAAATPRALAAFQPYLEGERPCPSLVRAQMVRALGPLARERPRLVRRFLTPLLLNAREDEAVRAAAASVVVLRARPPAAALRRLAHATRADPSRRVVTALRSALRAAARSRDPRDAHVVMGAQAALPFLHPAPLSAHYTRTLAATERTGGGATLHAQADVVNGPDDIVPDAVFVDVYKSTDDATLESLVQASLSMNSADFFYEEIMQEVLKMNKEHGVNDPEHTDQSESNGRATNGRAANGEEEDGCDDGVNGKGCKEHSDDSGFAKEFKKHPDLEVFRAICGNVKLSLRECGLRNLEYLIQRQRSELNESDNDEHGSENMGQQEGTRKPSVDGNVSQGTEGVSGPTRDSGRDPTGSERRNQWHIFCNYDSTGCQGQRARSGGAPEEPQGFTNEELGRLLGERGRPEEPFAGHVAFQALGAAYFVPFDAHFATKIAGWVRAEAAAAARGPDGRRIRVARLSPGAPAAFFRASALGVAAFAVAEAPAAAAVDGALRLRPGAPSPAHLRLRLLYSQKTSYRFGFALPFENTLYSAGVERDVQFHLPVDLQLSANFAWRPGGVPRGAFAATLAPLRRHTDERLLHYSVVPFVGRQSALQPAPPLVGHHDVVRGRAPPQSEAVVGAGTGVALRLAWTSEGRDAGAWALALEAVRSALPPWPSSAAQPLPCHYARLDLALDATRTHARDAHLAVAFGGGQDIKGEDSLGGAGDLVDSLWANASLRFQGRGLPNFDAWAQYSARADGTATRLRALFARGPSAHAPPFQIAARLDGRWAAVPLTDFRKVLAADHSSNVTARVAYAWSPALPPEKITVECQMSRSEARVQYLRRHPLAGACLKEEAAGAHLLAACRNITMRAGYLDQYLIHAQIPASLRNETRRALAAAQAWGWPFAQTLLSAPDASSAQTPVALRARVAFKSGGLRAVDARVEVLGREGGGGGGEGVALSGVPVPSLVRPLLVVHPRYDALRRLARKAMLAENTPLCGVELDLVNTFDNTTYPLQVGACWRVVLRTIAPKNPQSRNATNARKPRLRPAVTILIREPRPGYREVQIVLDKHVVLLRSGANASDGAQPEAEAEMLVNGHPLPLPTLTLDNWMRAHTLSAGGVLLQMPLARLQVVMDGRRLLVVANNGLRARVRGLCGTLTGRPRDDLAAPEGCVLSGLDAFVRAWTVPGPTCPGLPARDAWEPCAETRPAPVRLAPHDANFVFDPVSDSQSLTVSDSDYDSVAASDLESVLLPIPDHESRSASRETRLEPRTPLATPLPLPPGFRCDRGKTRIFREGMRYCFSQRPLPECSPYCSPARLLRKSVPFVCAAYSKVTSYWAQRAMQGEDVDFSQRQPNRWIVLSLPTRCV